MISGGDIYRKVIGFSSNEYNKFSTASLITRSTNDVQQVQMTMAMMFRIVLYAPIIGIGGVLRVLETDSSMTWILGVGRCADSCYHRTSVFHCNAQIYKASDTDRQAESCYKRNTDRYSCDPCLQQRET